MDESFNFSDFISIMQRLLAPDGCPWDRVQTHESLKRYMLEEAYEVVDAIDNNDKDNLCEELGDVLLQVVFHSILAQKSGEFTLDDVIDGVSKKMINRHRHIFGDAVADTPEAVLKSWEEIKKEEKGYKSKLEQIKSVPKSMPALMRADKIIGKACKLGLEETEQNTDNLYTELENCITELKGLKEGENGAKMDKIGKIMLLIANISRKNEINPEFALTNALETYINKLGCIEDGTVTED